MYFKQKKTARAVPKGRIYNIWTLYCCHMRIHVHTRGALPASLLLVQLIPSKLSI